MLPDLPAVLEQIRSGAVIGLAVTSPERSPFVPDVPTTTELGFPRVISYSWYGLIAPAGTPESVRLRVHDAAMTALAFARGPKADRDARRHAHAGEREGARHADLRRAEEMAARDRDYGAKME